MDKTDSILFEDIEKFFPAVILEGEVFACKKIVIPTKYGNLILQVGDTDDHYRVDFENTHPNFCNTCDNQIDSILY